MQAMQLIAHLLLGEYPTEAINCQIECWSDVVVQQEEMAEQQKVAKHGKQNKVSGIMRQADRYEVTDSKTI